MFEQYQLLPSPEENHQPNHLVDEMSCKIQIYQSFRLDYSLGLQQRAAKLRMSYSIMLYTALSTHGIKSILQKLIAAIPITNEEGEALRNLPRVRKLVTGKSWKQSLELRSWVLLNILGHITSRQFRGEIIAPLKLWRFDKLTSVKPKYNPVGLFCLCSN